MRSVPSKYSAVSTVSKTKEPKKSCGYAKSEFVTSVLATVSRASGSAFSTLELKPGICNSRGAILSHAPDGLEVRVGFAGLVQKVAVFTRLVGLFRVLLHQLQNQRPPRADLVAARQEVAAHLRVNRPSQSSHLVESVPLEQEPDIALRGAVRCGQTGVVSDGIFPLVLASFASDELTLSVCRTVSSQTLTLGCVGIRERRELSPAPPTRWTCRCSGCPPPPLAAAARSASCSVQPAPAAPQSAVRSRLLLLLLTCVERFPRVLSADPPPYSQVCATYCREAYGRHMNEQRQLPGCDLFLPAHTSTAQPRTGGGGKPTP
jgi:hypothetical protein